MVVNIELADVKESLDEALKHATACEIKYVLRFVKGAGNLSGHLKIRRIKELLKEQDVEDAVISITDKDVAEDINRTWDEAIRDIMSSLEENCGCSIKRK